MECSEVRAQGWGHGGDTMRVPSQQGWTERKVGGFQSGEARALHPPQASPRGWGRPSSLLLPLQTSLLERETPDLEVPVHLLTQGTLQSDPAGEHTLSYVGTLAGE